MAYNFNAGPAALPLPVLEAVQAEFVNFKGTGMSIVELSHRGKDYEAVHNHAKSMLYKLLSIPDDYEVLFVQGGASLQFAMVPMNFLASGRTANYILTGSWSEKALKEAEKIGNTYIGGSSEDRNYSYIPSPDQIQIEPDHAYVHITSNNTIFGTQWHQFPDPNGVPLVADMSSDILSRPIDVSQFGLIYAGAQKNLGPAGVTVVIIRRDWMEAAADKNPIMLKYTTHANANSLYNTPPTFAIYLLGKVLDWADGLGGVEAVLAQNKAKAQLLYDAIDESDGFYQGHAEREARSMMNVTFTLADKELESKFLQEAKARGFVGVNGHRSVGGCRASIYNAVPMEACEALRDFMIEFRSRN
ncbi:MAG: 3-phosphoserine/phosphohydroxythreonine transaminase [Firmicutes bacterium]|jgi:phosphoserine aminotransferase|nr:3-phosphoserine/phosphohydroxythreonine transaminase [Bacillota bacterium]HKM16593.1 3-phosphoserine/phosphohydroxythreonine transaminase [Limnochordia bacterium]